jgi:hypothetical protein
MSNDMTPLIVLQEIMAKWPDKNEGLDRESLEEKFFGYLADDFDFSNFANRPSGTFSVFSNVLLIGATAKILVYDTQYPEYPSLAVLKRTDDGRWRLKAFLFQCLSCFGTGILSPIEPCGTCGATGWGLVDYVNGETAI